MMAFETNIPDSILEKGVFVQRLAPIGESLIGSFFVGIIPLLIVLIMLGVFRLPAYLSAFSGLVVWYEICIQLEKL